MSDTIEYELQRVRELLPTDPNAAREIARGLVSRFANEDPRCHLALVAALQRLGRTKEMSAALEAAAAAFPNHPSILYNYGTALFDDEKWEQAVTVLAHARDIAPDDRQILLNLAYARRRSKDYTGAEEVYRGILAAFPDDADVLVSLAVVKLYQGDPGEAVKLCDQVLAQNPTHLGGLLNRALVLSVTNRQDAARRMLPSLVDHPNLDPQTSLHVGMLALRLGMEEAGWRLYERRPGRKTTAQPPWRGEDLSGKTLLVLSEQGYGDHFQVFRYKRKLKELVGDTGEVIWQCGAKLQSLFGMFAGSGSFLPTGAELPVHDFHISLMSLPAVMRNLGADEPVGRYLDLPPTGSAFWADKLVPGVRLHVGINWYGNPNHDGDRFRSIDLEKINPLFDLSDVAFYSLQREPAESRLIEFDAALHDNGGAFVGVAGLIDSLDMIVTVDTVTAHLAGALNKPCCLLLSTYHDFRWGTETDTTPLYPSLRLFRQKSFNDWSGPVSRVRDLLYTELARHR